MSRSFDVCEFLSQACRCPVCKQRLAYTKMIFQTNTAQAKCVRCGVTIDFAPPANARLLAKTVMDDWAKLLERPELQ